MELTQEQIDIINSSGDIKINAVAGSGKTSTIIEYAKKRAQNNKILYLAFNKAIKIEAIRKFKEKNISNVVIDTIHALAYKAIVYKQKYKLKENNYNLQEITALLNLHKIFKNYEKYIIGTYITNFFVYFCNSNKSNIKQIDYLDLISDKEAKEFIIRYYDLIINNLELLFSKMSNNEIPVIHDFYLKKYQLSKPILNYDYIIFDEAQDASEVILDIILKQKSNKVIVGDTNQQIYSWRYAINALEKTNFKTFFLSKSFRFNQNIADLSMQVLEWKKYINNNQKINIIGGGSSTNLKTKAVIARTNLFLIKKAMDYVSKNNSLLKKIYNFLSKRKIYIYFEGNLNSLLYTSEGISLYDVLNLYSKKYNKIKNPIIKEMKSFRDLYDYINKTDNRELSMIVEIVKAYKNKTLKQIKKLKYKIVNEKEKAEIIFSTVHKSKGLEYDIVEIASDFITEKKLKKLDLKFINKNDLVNLNEEINLLYVAITRAKNILYIPEELLPEDFQKVNTKENKNIIIY